MKVNSVSQLSSVANSTNFAQQIASLSNTQSYIEVSILSAGESYASYKINFSGFLDWISSSISSSIKGLTDIVTDLSSAVDDNFVHKTVSGNYSKYATEVELINGQKKFSSNVEFQLLVSANQLTVLHAKTKYLSATTSADIKQLSSNDINVTARADIYRSYITSLSAPNIHTTNISANCISSVHLTATTNPADLTAKVARWS